MTARTEPRRGVDEIARAPREESRHEKAAIPPRGDPALDAEVVRLTNRIALLTFATAFLVIGGLVALPTAFSPDETVTVRLAAAVPIVAALAGVVAVRRSRAMLRVAGGRAGVMASRT